MRFKLLAATVTAAALGFSQQASATIWAGGAPDPQNDVIGVTQPLYDVQSTEAVYDDVAGSLRMTWRYFNDVRPGSTNSTESIGRMYARKGPTFGGPDQIVGVTWHLVHQGGVYSVTISVLDYPASDIPRSYSGSGSLSADGRTVTAEVVNPFLVGRGFDQSPGGFAAGDTSQFFYLTPAVTNPAPQQPAPGQTIQATSTLTSPATSYRVDTKNGAVTRIGKLKRPWTLKAAIRAWGRPSSKRSLGKGIGCRVKWSRRGITATFSNFGALGRRTACTPRLGLLQTATITDSRYGTAAGLRPGSPVSDIQIAHPTAEANGSVWRIATVPCRIGSCDDPDTPTVEALTASGKVRALRIWIGAAGD